MHHISSFQFQALHELNAFSTASIHSSIVRREATSFLVRSNVSMICFEAQCIMLSSSGIEWNQPFVLALPFISFLKAEGFLPV